MARILVLSSFVAASRVGGGAQALALARLGIEPILVPTVLFGRHPGHGPPGGAAVAADTFAAMIDAIEAQGVFETLDAAVTGHFSAPEQVEIAARTLERVKAAAPAAKLIVDPIMGDEDKGLYAREPVAEAIAAALLPRADVIAPNAWELARLAGRPVRDLAEAAAAARALGRPAMVSSIRKDGHIGALYVGADEAWFAWHAPAAAAPRGTGDLLTAVFAAAVVQGLKPGGALHVAVGAVAEAVAGAQGLDELPLAALPTALEPSPRVVLETADG